MDVQAFLRGYKIPRKARMSPDPSPGCSSITCFRNNSEMAKTKKQEESEEDSPASQDEDSSSKESSEDSSSPASSSDDEDDPKEGPSRDDLGPPLFRCHSLSVLQEEQEGGLQRCYVCPEQDIAEALLQHYGG